MIGITNGVVGYIDNASGHYRPSRKNLLFGLQALRDQIGDLAMENVIVRDHSTAVSAPASTVFPAELETPKLRR